MTQHVLVAYATRTGVTKEIAQAVAESLQNNGATCEVTDATNVESVTGYDLVIVGSPIYGGALREETLTLLETHEMDLIGKPVAFFTVGMMPINDPLGAKAEHEGAVEFACMRAPGVIPAAHEIFAGAYYPDRVDFVARKLMERKKARPGDYTDWNAVKAWASSLAEKLAA